MDMKRAWNDINKYGEVPKGLIVLGIRLYPMSGQTLTMGNAIRSMRSRFMGRKTGSVLMFN